MRACDRLTERERALLGLAGRGRSTAAITRELGLATGTVKWYWGRIYSKLNVRCRDEAIVAARQTGVID